MKSQQREVLVQATVNGVHSPGNITIQNKYLWGTEY